MQTGLSTPAFEAIRDDMLSQCIHCGMCLPTCPTYALTLRERSSPRGRIRLMRAVAAGDLPISPIFEYEMNFCLDCRACETACPAGVAYGALVEGARAMVAANRPPGPGLRLLKRAIAYLFARQSRLQKLARLLRLYQNSGIGRLVRQGRLARLFSRRLEIWAALAPAIEKKFTAQRLPEVLPPRGPRRFRVALLSGCVQDVAFSTINQHTAEVLAYNGCEVWTPRPQSCCGSLHGHIGDPLTARRFALENLRMLAGRDLDAIITNAAGCGSFIKAYRHLFGNGDPEHESALVFAAKTRDICEFLVEAGFASGVQALSGTVAYHDACHLAHGQKIVDAPRQVLAAIPGIELVPLEEANWCCGSAGVYNLTHPATAMQLLERKVANIELSGAGIVALGNPGCAIHISAGLRRLRRPIEVVHPVTLLHRAYGLSLPPATA